MTIFKSFTNIFSISELRKKIFFTLFILIIDRLGTYIPVIGVNINALNDFINNSTGILAGMMSYFDMFSGGALGRSTIFALGISPYISASIAFQLLGMTVPAFEQLLKEGEYGRRIINQYTRYLTLVLSVVYSFSYALFLENKGLVLTPGWSFRILFVLTLSAGAMLVMWLGDQISLYGIGSGSSMLIFAGILSRYPVEIYKLFYMVNEGHTHFLIALAVILTYFIITGLIVFLEKGERKVSVQYSRRIIGNKIYGGQSTYIPFKINNSGVMPVIFATTILRFPMLLVTMLSVRFPFLKTFAEIFYNGPLFQIFLFVFIIMFSFFWMTIAINPEELAENIAKGGGFIPGLRPGAKTVQFFNYILTRVGLIGAIYLGILAILPAILNACGLPFHESGVSMLIAVGVALEFGNQLESYLIEHKYEGFLSSNKV